VRRLDCGIRLFRAGAAPLLLLSGGGTGPTPEAEIMRRMALACGVPQAALPVESGSRDTSRMRGRPRGCCGPAADVRSYCSATGITAYLLGTLEKAAAMANHASTRTARLYDHRRDELSVDEVERIVIRGRITQKRSKSVAEIRRRAERRWPKTRRAKMN
jgi:hypothetical protein